MGVETVQESLGAFRRFTADLLRIKEADFVYEEDAHALIRAVSVPNGKN